MKGPSKRKKLTGGVALAALVVGSSTVLAANFGQRLVGVQPDGSVLTTTDQFVTPAGQQVPLNGLRPNAVAVSPDGQTAAFMGAVAPGDDAIQLVDLATGKVKQNFDPHDWRASFAGLVYSHDGRHLYASMSSGSIVIANVNSDGTLTYDTTVQIPGDNPTPGGLAVSPDDKFLYIALSRNNTLGVLDLTTRKLVKEIPVGNAPWGVVIDGNIAYVSNQGGRKASAGDFTNDSSGTPIVANPVTGGPATGTVSVVDLKTGTTIGTIPVGLEPTAMYLSNNYLFVANTNSDTVSVIDTKKNQVVKTISIQPYPNAPFGSQPNAIAMMPGNRLAVSLGSNNAIAVYDWNGPSEPVVYEGLIPTGWYPGSLGIDWIRRRLVVANIKGTGSLGKDLTMLNKTSHNVYAYSGTASLIPFPTRNDMVRYTAEVIHNNGWDHLDDLKKSNGHVPPRPIPLHLGEPSTIKHVFFIIKENRTYDQVLGDMPQGNGDPNLVVFGQKSTPNQHALATQFPLLDNLYASGSISADAHQWLNQALAPDYVEKQFANFARSYPSLGGDSLAYLPTGFIWNDALAHGLTVRDYGEYVGQFNGPSSQFGTWQDWYQDSRILEGKQSGYLHVPLGTFQTHSDIPSLDPLLNRDYPPFNLSIPDQYRADIFLKEFAQYVKNGNLPNLIMMSLPNDHTIGTVPNFPTPEAMVADNDLALGRIVDAISHSPYWKDSAIFVVEDDAQSGVDHVDGHRTVGFVISPWVKRHIVDHTYYTQLDMVRTIEQILGLPPMNQMDAAATPMYNLFTEKPDFTPYNVVPNQIPLDQLNPTPSQIPNTTTGSIQAAWAKETAKVLTGKTSSDMDKENVNFLNRDIWYGVKGFNQPYPGDSKVLLPSEIKQPATQNSGDD